MASYYNENDPFAAAWLRELIKAGLIADGEVDERSIANVRPDDLRGFVQCHFFAGIGGWSYALRLAGWPDDREVWTGSCPCQPFSAAGTQTGGNDSRDLWPAWGQLIAQRHPATIFGEQVEAAIGHGWLDRICDDLEREDYAIGACSLPAASVGAFHIRQRLWFVAESAHNRYERTWATRGWGTGSADHGNAGDVADPDGGDAEHGGLQRGGEHGLRTQGRHADGDPRDAEQPEGLMADDDRAGRKEQRQPELSEDAVAQSRCDVDGRGAHDELGDPDDAGPQRRILRGQRADQRAPWAPSLVEWIPCTDGKARPVESGTFPLAYGIPARVGRLRGYGNAIVPQVAQVFIEAYLDSEVLADD